MSPPSPGPPGRERRRPAPLVRGRPSCGGGCLASRYRAGAGRTDGDRAGGDRGLGRTSGGVGRRLTGRREEAGEPPRADRALRDDARLGRDDVSPGSTAVTGRHVGVRAPLGRGDVMVVGHGWRHLLPQRCGERVLAVRGSTPPTDAAGPGRSRREAGSPAPARAGAGLPGVWLNPPPAWFGDPPGHQTGPPSAGRGIVGPRMEQTRWTGPNCENIMPSGLGRRVIGAYVCTPPGGSRLTTSRNTRPAEPPRPLTPLLPRRPLLARSC